MKPFTRALIVGGGLIALILCWSRIRDREPHYRGVPLGEWAYRLEATGRGALAIESIEALNTIGTNGIPSAITRIRYDRQVEAIFLKVPFLGPWLDENAREELRLANAAPQLFQALGRTASPAIPELVTIVQTTSSNGLPEFRSIRALVYIGDPATPHLLRYLQSQDAKCDFTAHWLAQSSMTQFHRPQLLITELVSLSHRSTNQMRSTDCVRALAKLAREPSVTIPALIAAFRSGDPEKREAAVSGFRRFAEKHGIEIKITADSSPEEFDTIVSAFAPLLNSADAAKYQDVH